MSSISYTKSKYERTVCTKCTGAGILMTRVKYFYLRVTMKDFSLKSVLVIDMKDKIVDEDL